MVGSVIATYTTWRAIFGVLSGISFIGLVLAYFFVPKASELSNLSTHESVGKKLSRQDVLRAFNPSAVFYQWKYPGVILSVSRNPSSPLNFLVPYTVHRILPVGC